MLNKIKCLLCLLFLVLNGSVFAQKFKHLTRDNGLSSNRINAILEDRQGFMWFGTEDGLSKFNGYNFQIYRNIPNDSESIPDNTIDCIVNDVKTHNLWLATRSGVVYFDRIHQKFTIVVGSQLNDQETGNINITDLCFDAHNNLWISTYTGLFVLNTQTNQVNQLFHANNNNKTGANTNRIYCLYKDNKGDMWVGYQNGLLRYNADDASFTSFLSPYNIAEVYEITQDSDQNFWIGTDKSGLFYVNGYPDKGEVKVFNNASGHFASNRVHRVIEDEPGKFYFMVRDGGLYYYDKNTDELIYYGHDIYNPNSINSAALISAYKSSNGIVWFGTYNSGVNFVDKADKQFDHYCINFKADGLFSNNIRALYQDSDNNIWVGTKEGGGLSCFSAKTGTFKNYKADKKSGLTDDYIFAIAAYDKQNLLIGTFRKGLAMFNKQSEKFSYFTANENNPYSLSDNRVYAIFKDDQGLIWVGNYSHLQLFDGAKKRFTTIPNIQRPRCFCVEDEDRIWIGSKEHGLYLYNKISGKFINYLHDASNPKSISSNDIIAISKDKEGYVWIGTKNGLNRWDYMTNDFIHFTEADGLASNWICGVLIDDDNNIWISTSNGISKFNYLNNTFKNYDIKDGLQSNEFEAYVALKTNDNMLLFGGRNGFNYFNPALITDNIKIPNIVFTGFKLFNKELPIGKDNSPLQEHIGFTNEITLKHNQSAITFEYVALNYTSPEKNQYEFKLNGFDEDWIQAGTKNEAVYTNIPPGKYQFLVKGSNNDNYWNEEGISVGLIIKNPFWKTVWAYLIYTFIFGLLVYLIRGLLVFRIEQKNLLDMERVENERIQEMNQLKLRFFTNISHEFRTPLTLLLGPLNKLASYQTDNDEQKYLYKIMQNNVQRLLKLVTELMDFRKVEHGQLKLKVAATDLVVFVQQIIDCFDEAADDKQIDLAFNYKNMDQELYWFDKSVLDKIIFNLLSNAFKYTPAKGCISVTLQKKNQLVELCVTDSGTGIPQEKLAAIFERFYQVDEDRNIQGTGIGLAFTKRLVALHHGEVNVTSELGKGTRFVVTLPMNKEAFADHEISKHSSIKENSIKQSVEVPALPENDAKELRTEQILIVEDNKELRGFLENHFSQFVVYSAENGKIGYQIANSKMPDLIISDIMMPEMNGLELCKKVKTHFATSHIPVILLTAKAEISQKTEGIETGADAYIEKPFDIKYLNARVENLLLQRKVLRKRYANETEVEADDLVLNMHEKKFVEKTKSLIESNISNPDFSVEALGLDLGLSRSQLFRKFKAIYELKPSEFIRNERLKYAKKLLIERNHNVNEIADLVGFKSASYFITSFKKFYGKTPVEFLTKK